MTSTSGGGVLICQTVENKIMWYSTQAREAYPCYQPEAIGNNYVFSNLCVDRGQITVADEHIAHHKKPRGLYKKMLADVPDININVYDNPDSRYDYNF